MFLFYSTKVNNGSITLEEQEAHHCSRVLRKNIGDRISVTDGQGNLYEGDIEKIQKDAVLIKITTRQIQQADLPEIHIGIGMLKNSGRLEWLFEKMTEIGVSSIFPLSTEHAERNRINPDRMNKILLSAMKQSFRAFLPKLYPVGSLDYFIKHEVNSGQKLVGHYAPGNPEMCSVLKKKCTQISLLIGPEGDFSSKEMDQIHTAGYNSFNLGHYRLRTETAALVSLGLCRMLK